MDIIQKLAAEFKIKTMQVEHTVELIDEGNTIPFIARYRKEVTGGLSDVTLRDLDERLKYLRNLEERKADVKRLIEEQDKFTEEIGKALDKGNHKAIATIKAYDQKTNEVKGQVVVDLNITSK